MISEFWKQKSVLVTGHTGFKGGWLSIWLNRMGAKVHGYSLQPPSAPSLFECLQLPRSLASDTTGDICDRDRLGQVLERTQPEIILHLAAQPLVIRSYEDPWQTYQTNVMGTVNLLDLARRQKSIRSIVNVTTDKCYENREWAWAYRENEPMGGHDPYSNSKACSELVTAAYRNSFFREQGIGLASARAGNVIGGGDWAENRLIPDLLRSLDNGHPIKLRCPNATRPWQHVLEPLAGYLRLAQRLHEEPNLFDESYNFGPSDEDSKPVCWIADQICKIAGRGQVILDSDPQFHEATSLKLDSSKAKSRLGWRPRWNLTTALERTLQWHEHWRNGSDMGEITCLQIDEYQDAILSQKSPETRWRADSGSSAVRLDSWRKQSVA